MTNNDLVTFTNAAEDTVTVDLQCWLCGGHMNHLGGYHFRCGEEGCIEVYEEDNEDGIVSLFDVDPEDWVIEVDIRPIENEEQ